MTEHPWLATYPKHVKWDQKFTAKPLYALVEDTAAEFPDLIAYDFMGKTLSYRDLLAQVNHMAKGLQELGVKKGRHVGIFMPNCTQFAVAYFGILKAGGTVVNYSPLYSEHELIQQVEDSETDIMITLDLAALYPTMHKVAQQSRLKHLVVDQFASGLPFPKNILFKLFKSNAIAKVVKDDCYVKYAGLLQNDGQPTPVDIDPVEDVAIIQYTGGTTGIPKGAMLTHANIYINVLQVESWAIDVERGQEIIIGCLPFFHVFAMTVVMDLSIFVGAKVVIQPKFELEGVIKMMKKEKPTLFAGVPAMFTALANHPLFPDVGMDNVKVCMSGGAPLPVELGRTYRKVMNVNVSEGYGLTETSPVCVSNPYDRDTRKGSIGLPIPDTEVIIVDRQDPSKRMPLGESGEICIRGPQVMKGYWKRPDATAEVMVGGMLRTGDVGYMDEEGFTYIIDRSKDLILVGGFNVYPRVVEEVFYQHPAVHEVTVIGIPDDYLGERPKAFVTLKNPDDSLTEAELMSFVRERLGKHERPKEIEFRAELPKTMVGKLSKKELVAEEKAKYEQRKAD
ncbi:Long-chain-fatty-acid--CoA ligase [hydrothermal vent metagenome]|uniref:Long-chain-fatty-acid--CoA ligase n=1 Tax=hydrothermal vent metagenome TaxID=652676 RepID=A0A3B0R2Y4_9ZZZZ